MIQPKNNQIISINEARKILGAKYSDLTDADIARLIEQLDGIATAYIKSVPKY